MYNGNQNLKSIGEVYEWGEHEISEYVKCQQDPIYFIENYCHIVTLDHGLQRFALYEKQKELVHTIINNRKVISMQFRQSGKTTVSAAVFLWYSLFNENYTIAIMANKGSAARECLSRFQLMYENLPLWMQQGIKTWNKGDIELENGSKIFTGATSASGIRGKTVNLLYIDEAAIIPNHIAEQFFASVYPVISSGKTTKILVTSTPLGYNHFWALWTAAKNDKNGFIPFRIDYWEIPGRDEEWAEEQRKTLGEVKFNQEINLQFLGSSKSLVSGAALQRLTDCIQEPIFADEEFRLKVYVEPQKDRTYVGVVDTSRGVGGDFSVCCIFDVTDTPYKLVARYRDNKIAPMLFPNVIQHLCQRYNEAYVLIETNDIGGEVADLLFHEQEYENLFSTVSADKKTFITPGFGNSGRLGVMTTKSVKRIGCFTLKNLAEENKLLIPDAEAVFELSTFIEKAGSFQADEGYHDDMAMTLVLFGWLTRDGFFKDLTNVDIRKKLYEKQMENIDADLTPFGFIDDGIQRPETEVHNGCLWVSAQGGELPWKTEVDEFRAGNFTDDHDVPWPF